MTAEQSVEFGLIDKVLSSRDEMDIKALEVKGS